MTIERRAATPFILRFRAPIAGVDPRASDADRRDAEDRSTVADGETRITGVGRETTDDN